MCVCLKFFWCVIFGSLVAEKKLSCVRCKHSFKELKYIKLFLFRKDFEDHKNTELLIVKVSDFPQEKKSWSCNHIPKAEQRLEKGLKKQRQIIAKFESKDKKGVSSIYIIYEHCDTENSFGDYVAMVSFKTHIQISCARSYLAQWLFVSNFRSNFDGKKVTSRPKIIQAFFCSLAPLGW